MAINLEKEKDFERSDFELQEFLIFAICVAGKTAKTMARLVSNFILSETGELPLKLIKKLVNSGELENALRCSRIGQYTKLQKTFEYIVECNLCPRTCTLNDLLAVPGIGNKTSRFFLSFTRPNQRFAILDTHILKWLYESGYDVPKNTPADKQYKEIEQIFLKYCDIFECEPVDFDYMIWESYAKLK